MANYFVGDIHGCFYELDALLKTAAFNPHCDTLWVTGDLLSRGPEPLQVLRFLHHLHSINAAKIVLGNHDLHFLARSIRTKKINAQEGQVEKIFSAADSTQLLLWLRTQPLLLVNHTLKTVLVHAGVTPQWDLAAAQHWANEVSLRLQDDVFYPTLLKSMYNRNNTSWYAAKNSIEKLLFSTNALTRMRYCLSSGDLDLQYKDLPEKAPANLQPWFMFKRKISSAYSIIFGHWATLKKSEITLPAGIYPLDTGCCWGGELTMLRWEDKCYFKQKARFKI